MLEDLIGARKSGSKLEQLADAFWDEFGGAGEIAHMVRQAYLQAKDGSLTQIRITDMVVKVLMHNDAKSKTLSEELDAMHEDQLNAILRESGVSKEAGAESGAGGNSRTGGAEEGSSADSQE